MPKSATNLQGWYQRGYLPHFDPGQAPQLITFRLVDSFPTSVLQEWESEFATMVPEKVDSERRRRIEEYLDHGHGSAWLSQPEIGEIVAQSVLHFAVQRYQLHAWCVMPNHVHVILTPNTDQPLNRIVHSWKSFSSNRANCYLKRTGAFWQREYFDRFIRDERHFEAAVHYVEHNPVKAGLCSSANEWRFSSAFSAATGKNNV
jgi:putative DNA methylase